MVSTQQARATMTHYTYKWKVNTTGYVLDCAEEESGGPGTKLKSLSCHERNLSKLGGMLSNIAGMSEYQRVTLSHLVVGRANEGQSMISRQFSVYC